MYIEKCWPFFATAQNSGAFAGELRAGQVLAKSETLAAAAPCIDYVGRSLCCSFVGVQRVESLSGCVQQPAGLCTKLECECGCGAVEKYDAFSPFQCFCTAFIFSYTFYDKCGLYISAFCTQMSNYNLGDRVQI
jgi:hypothetical protein